MKNFLLLFCALFAMTFFAKAQVPVFTEDFEGSSIPSEWTIIDADNDGYNWEHSSVKQDVTGYNSNGSVVSYSYINATYEELSPDNWLISPAIYLNGTSSLSFWFAVAQSYPEDHFGIYISTTSATDTTTFTSIFDYTPTSANGNWTQQTIDLTNYAGDTVYIAFRHFNCTNQFILVLDDIVVYSGTTETVLTVNPSSVNFGTVGPNEQSTVASVLVTGYNTTSTISATVNSPFEISNDNTSFGSTATLPAAGGTLYVRYSPTTEGTNNGTVTLTSGTATASIMLTGTAVDCNVTLPYTETFETTSPYLGCWTMSGNGTWSIGTGDYSSGTGAYEGTYNAVITHSSNGNVTKLISPILDGTDNGLALTFAYVMRSWDGDTDELRVYSRTGANSAWQQVAEYTDPTSTWTLETVFISGAVYQIAFEMTDNYGYGVGIDNVNFSPTSTDFCYPVTNLTASNITAHEATLTWSGDANSYTIYNMDDSSVATVNDTIYNLTNLTSDSQHSFGVVANCTSDSSDMVIVNFHTQISCPVPTGLNVTYNPNEPTEVTLSWTENGTATQWQLVLNNDETNIINVNQNPYTLTNLVIGSSYTVKVRANCDVDEQSAWSSSTSFEPSSKTVIGSGNATSTYLPTNCLYNYSLTQQIYTVAELGDAGLIESIDLYNNGSSALTRDLSIYMVNTTKDTFASATDWISVTAADLQYSGNITFAPGDWTTITLNGFEYDGLHNIAIIVDDNTNTWVYTSYPFKVFEANKQALRVHNDNINYDVTAPDYNGTVTNVKNQIRLTKGNLASCLKPAGVTISYAGGLTAEVSWTSNAPSFNIRINDVVTNNVTSPFSLTGLDLNTTYTVSVQAVCDGSSISDWTNPASFTTDACMPEDRCPITIVGTDSYGDGWGSSSITVIQNGATVGTFTVSGSSSTATYNVCHNVPVSFAWNSSSYFDDECDFTIYYSDSIAVFSANGDDVTGTFYTLADACPSCISATALTVDTTTENSVTISWTGTAASYNIYNGENLVANVTTTTYTFTGLTAATIYEFGVQAVCSANDSAIIVTISAMTECAEITPLPYHESFDHSLGCWSTVNASIDGEPWDYMDNISYAHTGTGAAASSSFTYHAVHADAWLISPKFILPAVTDDSLTLSWWHKVYANYPHEFYDVMISTTTNDIASFTTTLLSVSPDSVNDYVQKMVNITAYAGQEIYIAFHHHDSYDQAYLIIDDIELFEGGYVPPATDSMIIHLSINNPALGSISPDPGTFVVALNETLILSATPNADANFDGWRMIANGEILGTIPLNPFTIVVNSNMIAQGEMTILAVFSDSTSVPDSLTIVVNTADATMGTTNPTPGTYSYAVGEQSILAAIPNEGYHNLYWVESITASGMTVYDTLYADTISMIITPMMAGIVLHVTAYFEADTPGTESLTFHLSINNPALGSISPDPGTYVVALNDSLVLSATPNTGINFDGWRISVGDQTLGTIPINPFTIPVTPNNITFGEMTIVAMFNDGTSGPDSMTVIINTADATMGTTSPAPGTYNFAVGSESHIAAIPNEGYHNLYWIEYIEVGEMSVSDTLYADTIILTVHPIMAGLVTSLTAYFEADEPGVNYYSVNVTSANPAMGTVSSSTPFTHLAENTVVTVDAYPNPNYMFVNWTDATGAEVSTSASYTFTVTADITLIANFAPEVGINDIDASNVLIYAHNSTICVRGAEGHDVFVYDMNGRCIYQHVDAKETENISMSSAGIYLVRIDNAIFKKVVIVK
jgi:hypothetical protein